MLPRYRVEVQANAIGRFEIEMYTPIDALTPFFRSETICASEDEAYGLAEQLLVKLTGCAVQQAKPIQRG